MNILIHWSQLKTLISVCVSNQHVRVLISNSSASVVALTAFVRLLPHVRPHMYLKTWCVYAREALVTFVCLFTSVLLDQFCFSSEQGFLPCVARMYRD